MGVKEPATKRISGDGLSMKLRCNEQILQITGDGCSVTMKMNCGSVRIVGDGCRLSIDQNMGDIEYVGDGGHVFLGAKSIKDKVKYVGDGGTVSFNGRTKVKDRNANDSLKVECCKDFRDQKKCFCKINNVRSQQMDNVLNTRKKETRVIWDWKEKTERFRIGSRTVVNIDCNKKILQKNLKDTRISPGKSSIGKFVV